ncbi:MAG TPA: class II fructose-bisphosphate aldolase [Symbiobacteriaceae bacterium]
MALVTLREVLLPALREGYGVGAFNIYNLETAQAVLQAAYEQSAPVILQATAGSLKHAGARVLAAMVRALAEPLPIPVVLHLDHGESPAMVAECLEAGFTSVMIDGSGLPFAENAALTREVVAMAHKAGASVEAELGHVTGRAEDADKRARLGITDPSEAFTPPEDAARFAAETGVDALAVAFGTVHGPYKGEPNLDFPRLEAIHRLVPDLPLVMHGGSGLPLPQLRRAIASGVAKVNIGTEVKHGWASALRQVLQEHPEETDPRRIMGPTRDSLKAIIAAKIAALGSAGRA